MTAKGLTMPNDKIQAILNLNWLIEARRTNFYDIHPNVSLWQ